MKYTETELLEQLDKDMAHPDQLYQKPYCQEESVTVDTKRSVQEVAAEYLLAHLPDLKRTETNWGMVHTSMGPMKQDSRWLLVLQEQKEFFHGVFLNGAVRLTNGLTQEIGHFDFMTMDFSGNRISLFELISSPLKETVLGRILRLWSVKESLQKDLIQKVLQIEKDIQLQAIALVTGASNDRYGLQKKNEEPICFKQLAASLGVSTLYLFHGTYAEPVSLGLRSAGQMTKAELLLQLETDSKHPTSLYQKDYVNRFGVTADTREPYSQVISDWLLAHRDIWMGVPHGLYRLEEGKRVELLTKNTLFQQMRRQKVLPPFGAVLSRDMTFLGNRGQQLGRSVLLLYDSQVGKRAYSLVRMVEIADSSDSLLRAVLRSFSRLVTVDQAKLMEELHLPEETTLESRILVEAGSRQDDWFQRDLGYVHGLMRAMGVGLMTLKEGYEAMY